MLHALSCHVMSCCMSCSFIVHTTLFSNIAVMILVPGFDDQAIHAFISCCTDANPVALVLALYGSGNAPARKQSFIDTLKRGLERGAVIVITSQCMRGSVGEAGG